MDDVQDAVSMRDEFGLEFPVLYDTDHAVTAEWGLFNLLGDGVSAPATFIIRTDGTFESALIGTNISERPTTDSVLEVLASLAGMDRAMLPPGDDGDSPNDVDGMEDAVTVRATATSEAVTAVVAPESSVGDGSDTTSDSPPTIELEIIEEIKTDDTPAPPPSLVPVPVVSGPPVVGGPVPDFDLPTARGESISLSEHVGEKNVVFVFFRAWW